MQGTHYEQIYESRVGNDTLINTNEPSAAALIRAQGQQLRKETVLEYWRRTRGNNNAEMGRNRTEKRIPQGIHKAKNREALIKDQIQQLRLDTMFPALQGDGIPRGSSQKDLSDYTAKIESLMEELKKEWVESVIRYERIRKAINKMNDEQEKEALTRYYLLRENNKAIQRKMGVSKAKLYRIYDSALENFEIL